MKIIKLKKELLPRSINLFYYFFLSFLLFLLCILQPVIPCAQMSEQLDKKVENAIFYEDWENVVKFLDSVNTGTSSTVLRLIKGHANLVLNRNNESLCLFQSVSLSGDFSQWKEWSLEVTNKYKNNVVANYFNGDASARLEKWDDALMAFNKAEDIRPNHPLVLNARGAVYAALGKWDEALIDLSKATIMYKQFADAYASLGTIWIQRRTGAKGAFHAFNRALNLSPNFALAFNGRGGANFALDNWDDAQKDFEEAGRKTNCLPIANINLNALMLAKIDYIKREGEILAKNNPGMQTKVKIQTLQKEITKAKQNIVRDIAMQTFNNTVNDLGMTGKIYTEVSIDTKMRGKPTALAKIGGEIKFNPDTKSAADYTTNWTKKDMGFQYDRINAAGLEITQLRQKQSLNPSGVKTELRQAFIDSGDWPIDSFYGLFYFVEPLSTTGSNKK